MLPAQLFKAVIDEEKKGVSDASLRAAAVNVAKAYSQKALKNGCTYLDYSKPQNRCAYLYKYANVHTRFVTKHFRKLLKKKAAKNILYRNRQIRICCLGGGSGIDIVGVFKVLALFPHMHQKVCEATVLDLSLGWHNSFNHIIQNLINGKVKDVPETFVREDFKANFVEVDLLKPLPAHVIETVSKADVICMVKFVSAVLGNKNSVRALKILADLFKIGAIILFIDNFQGNVAQSIQDISELAGLQIVLGPDVESIHVHSESVSKTFGCKPLENARVTVIGLIKTKKSRENISFVIGEDSDDGWDTESEESNPTSCMSNNSTEINVKKINKYTQTEQGIQSHSELMELNELFDALSELATVMFKYKEEYLSCKCHVN